jgi:hypothetical protein
LDSFAWALSDGKYYTRTGTDLSRTSIRNSTYISEIFESQIQFEFLNNLQYDPTLTVLFDPITEPSTVAVDPEFTSVTGLIVGVTIAAIILAVAVTVAILAVFIPSVRNALMPWRARQLQGGSLVEDFDREEPKAPRRDSEWQRYKPSQ